jgi:PLP dependent protein
MDPIAQLAVIKEQIAAAAKAAINPSENIDLVAVSKTRNKEDIWPFLKAGHRIFGENRIQEAQEKWPAIRETFDDVRLHLIGPLQRNKLGRALELFDCIETLDRPKLAVALAEQMKKSTLCKALYIQVNTGEEPQKAGVMPEDADQFIKECLNVHRLPVIGLMCIPPHEEEPSLHFALLREIAQRHGLAELSMGMSADFETAIRFGATSVRLGTALFGPRPKL